MATTACRPAFTGQRFTVDEFDALRIPETHAVRFELLDGHILVTPFGSREHQRLCTRLMLLLGRYIEEPRLGEIHSPGVIYGPVDIELQPDVLVTGGRYPLRASWVALTTRLLAIEILSPSNESTDLVFKRGAYLELGFREVWLVNPLARSVTVAGRGPRDLVLVAPASFTWQAPGALGALTIDLGALFE